MKALNCSFAVLLLGVGGQGNAASYAWCQMSGGNHESYLSAIVEIDDGPEAFRLFVNGPFGTAFGEYIRGKFDRNARSLNCMRESSYFFANDHIEVMINANPGIKFVQTGWRDGEEAPVPPSTKSRITDVE